MLDESIARRAAVTRVAMATPAGPSHAGNDHGGGLMEVATGRRQWTGIVASAHGRVFVNFPRWRPDVPISAGQLDRSGIVSPYPNERLNSWINGDDATEKFVRVQSVHIDLLDGGPYPSSPYRVMKLPPPQRWRGRHEGQHD